MFGLELDRVRKTYQDYAAVDDVSLAIPHGQFVCFLGHKAEQGWQGRRFDQDLGQ